jgi:gamma-glutamyltranspeptidase/glutathione hydrolase
VAQRVAWDWERHVAKLKADAATATHYLVDGKAPKEGDVVRFPALAQTLKTVATKGARAFYEGAIAEDIVATVSARGSFLTRDDFANHRGDIVEPISTHYRGLDLVEIPPNGQGITALVMLNILENFDLAALDPYGPERFHLVLEAARLGFAVRDTHIADAASMRVAVADLLEKGFAKRLASKIDMKKRAKLPPHPTPGSDTIYVTVVDRDRMACSFINSLYSSFGTGICTEKTGILLNNRGACFTLAAGHPNVFGPGKRPMHTIIPALAMQDGRCDMSFGVMGADYQPMGHVQIVTNMRDYRMDVQQAIDAPRFFFEDELTVVERGTDAKTIEGLKQRGHNVVMAPTPWGGAQTILIDWQRGVLIGGSEPRKDGCALGY